MAQNETPEPMEIENKKTPSDKQITHLKYAREAKKAKKEYNDKLGQSLNDNLEFIFTRLKHIDNKLNHFIPANSVKVESDTKPDKEVKEEFAKQAIVSSVLNYSTYMFAGFYTFFVIIPRIREYVGQREERSMDGDKINPYTY